MLIREYPVNLQNGVQIFCKSELDGYLIKYKDKEDNHCVVWLRDELINPCNINSKAYEAIEIAKNHINSLRTLNQ
jgi:hypothetical protein